MKLSIIIPVFNEKGTVVELLDRVGRVAIDKEIIIIDDGSTDGTREILKDYDRRLGFVVLYHDRNHGKGRAIRTGLDAVSGEVVVIQDADLEYDPQDFVPMIELIRQGRTQVVYGSRRLLSTNRQHSGVIYYLGGMLVTYMTRWLYGLDITDEATCYKMLKTSLIRSLDLQCEHFEFCPELTAKLANRKIPILEIPISYIPRHKSEGKKIGWRDAVEAIWTLLKFRFRS